MFAVSPTDKNWFDSLKQNQMNSYVNFWTPTPWNVRIKPGSKWFFMLKVPIRKIAGYGEVVEYRNLSIDEAWQLYGKRNGTSSKEELVKKTKLYVEKNSIKHPDKNFDSSTYLIGCLILNNCEYWDEYQTPSQLGFEFKKQIVKYKIYITDYNTSFNIVNEPREQYKNEVNARKGQGVFKGLLVKAYNNKCCISGETCPELLEAAHIQPYLNEFSNHVSNGLLLRVDIHRLYDNDLLYIDESYVIHISSLLTDESYHKFHGKKISLPIDIWNYPSIDALKLREEDFRH